MWYIVCVTLLTTKIRNSANYLVSINFHGVTPLSHRRGTNVQSLKFLFKNLKSILMVINKPKIFFRFFIFFKLDTFGFFCDALSRAHWHLL